MLGELPPNYYSADGPPSGPTKEDSPPEEVMRNRSVTRALPFQMRSLSKVKNDLLSDLGGLCFTQSIWTVKDEASGQPDQLMMIGGHSNTSTESDALKFLWKKTAVSGIPIGRPEFLGYQSYDYPHKNANSGQDETRTDDVRVYTLTLPPILSPLVVNPERDKIRRIFGICPTEMFFLFENGKITDSQYNEEYKIPDNLKTENDHGIIFPAKLFPQAAQELIANASIKFELATVERVMKFYLDNVFHGKENKKFNQIKDRWKQNMKKIHSQVKGKDALIRTQELLKKTFEGIEDLYPHDPSGESKPRKQMIDDFCKWYEHALFQANIELVEHTGPQQAFIIEHGLSADNIFAQGNYERVEHNAKYIFTPLFDTAWATFGINKIDVLTAMGQKIRGELTRTVDHNWLKNTRDDMARCRKHNIDKQKDLTTTFLHRLNISQSTYNEIANATNDFMTSIIRTLGEDVEKHLDSDRSLLERFYSVFNIGPKDKRGGITDYSEAQRSHDWRWLTLFMTFYNKYPRYQEKIALPHDHFDDAFTDLVEKVDTEPQTIEIGTHTYTRHTLKQSLIPQTILIEPAEGEIKEISLPQDVPIRFLSLWRKKVLESFGRKLLERGDEDLTYINDYFARQIVPEVDSYLDSIWEQISFYEIPRQEIRKSLVYALTHSILDSYKDSLEKQNDELKRIKFNRKGIYKTFEIEIPEGEDYNGGSGAGNFSDKFDFFKVVQTSKGVQEELQILLDPKTKIEDDKRYNLERILYPARVPAGNFALLFVLFGQDKEFYERMLRKHLGD